MPFLDDIGPDDEALQHPLWGVFALVKDNLERMVAANVGWAAQCFPAIAALAFPQLPAVVRVLLLIYTAAMLTPATGILYVWMARVNQHETLRLEMLWEDFRNLALPSLFCLAPLFGSLGLSYMLILLLGLLHILLLDVLARFTFLVLLVCALYWGPLFALLTPGLSEGRRFRSTGLSEGRRGSVVGRAGKRLGSVIDQADKCRASPFFLLRQSLLLVWKYPGPTVVTGLVALLVVAIGVGSIAGFFLIAPVVVALLQTRRCFALLARLDERSRHPSGVPGDLRDSIDRRHTAGVPATLGPHKNELHSPGR